MRTELPYLRTARSATYDNSDGTRTLEVVGGHAHHLRNGLYVPTDLTWAEAASSFDSGEYPVGVSLNKTTRTLMLDYGDDVLTLSPRSARVPTSVDRTGSTPRTARKD